MMPVAPRRALPRRPARSAPPADEDGPGEEDEEEERRRRERQARGDDERDPGRLDAVGHVRPPSVITGPFYPMPAADTTGLPRHARVRPYNASRHGQDHPHQPLLEALRSAPERVNKVFVQEETGPRPHRRGHPRGQGPGMSPSSSSRSRRLDQIAPGHQGVMAEVSPKSTPPRGHPGPLAPSPSWSSSTRSRTPRTSAPSSAAPRARGPTASSCPSAARPA
ncbi:MAG: hypothetical protein MZV49_00035 [Rhodopseudomonas palustris]|nr:hypothetical protein [Rhodopseudomonas palustris]